MLDNLLLDVSQRIVAAYAAGDADLSEELFDDLKNAIIFTKSALGVIKIAVDKVGNRRIWQGQKGFRLYVACEDRHIYFKEFPSEGSMLACYRHDDTINKMYWVQQAQTLQQIRGKK